MAKVEQSVKEDELIPPVMKEITLAVQKWSALVDTGSDYSLMSESSTPKDVPRKKAVKQLKWFGGSVVESAEIIETVIQMDRHEMNVAFLVVPDEFLP